eukprot:350214-Chlamydomonas_euryale.AAC.1
MASGASGGAGGLDGVDGVDDVRATDTHVAMENHVGTAGAANGHTATLTGAPSVWLRARTGGRRPAVDLADVSVDKSVDWSGDVGIDVHVDGRGTGDAQRTHADPGTHYFPDSQQQQQQQLNGFSRPGEGSCQDMLMTSEDRPGGTPESSTRLEGRSQQQQLNGFSRPGEGSRQDVLMTSEDRPGGTPESSTRLE